MAATALCGVAQGAVIEEAEGLKGRATGGDERPGPVRADAARFGIMKNQQKEDHRGARTIIGKLSGKKITIPDVNVPPMPALAPPGVIHNGRKAENFGEIDSSRGYPDVRSFSRKFGLVIPATNTSMEHELWGIIFKNQGPDGLRGVGLHTANVITPKPKLETEADLLEYKKQFLGGLKAAVDAASLAQPQYMIMGMSLEHIIGGIEEIRAPVVEIETYSGLAWATWHDAIQAALGKYGAKRIGILTPFDKKGNESAARMFEELGFDVVSSVGFSCANALHIAHVPDWAKEKAILELLATGENKLDAIVQCGTNMSLINVTEKLEPVIGIPILGINAVTFWYALRENGFEGVLAGAGRLLREF
jgi:maleate isomerase